LHYISSDRNLFTYFIITSANVKRQRGLRVVVSPFFLSCITFILVIRLWGLGHYPGLLPLGESSLLNPLHLPGCSSSLRSLITPASDFHMCVFCFALRLPHLHQRWFDWVKQTRTRQ